MRIGLVLVLISVLTACGPSIASGSTATPPGASNALGSASGPRIAQPPVTPPTPPGDYLPPFACSDAAGGKTGVANTIAARLGEQDGYDRFVLQFDSIVPTFAVKRQATPVFSEGASGQTVTLLGKAGVLVTVHSATGATTFTGPTDVITNQFIVLKEARQVQDFEGYVTWGLGVDSAACMRVFVLDQPARLVVDFQLPGT
jgi:hypothetical protein